MRGRSAVAAAALIVVSLSGQGAGATPQPPSVAGTTVLQGDRSGTLRVRVPEESILDVTPTLRNGALTPKALRTKGGSGYVGFLLTPAGGPQAMWVVAARLPRPIRDGGNSIAGVGSGLPVAADRPTVADPGLLGDKPPRCQRCRIPAGVYDLQLFTGTKGGPGTVTIAFEGLDGKTDLSTTTSTYPFGTVWRFGKPRSADLGSSGSMFSAVGWSIPETGVALTTNALHVTLDSVPAGVSSVRTCRSVRSGPASMCDETRVAAGPVINIAGSGALEGNDVESVSVTQSYDWFGNGTYQSEVGLLWLPTAGSHVVPIDTGSSREDFLGMRVVNR